MLEVFGQAAGFRLFHFSVGLCPFLYSPGMTESPNPNRPICLERTRRLARIIEERFRGRTIIWGGFWRLFLDFVGSGGTEKLQRLMIQTLDWFDSLGCRVVFLGTPVTSPSFPNPCPFAEPDPSSDWRWCAGYHYR